MAAIRVGPRPTSAAPSIAPRRRLTWFAVAGVTGWMAATTLTILAFAVGLAHGTESLPATAVVTLIAASMLYLHFQRLARIDEALVIGVVLSWAATLGLLSL